MSFTTLINSTIKGNCLRFYHKISFSEKFLCPENTVKCPDSYCIEQRLLCDGHIECPGREDEQDCSK
jgi:hypothetical protein